MPHISKERQHLSELYCSHQVASIYVPRPNLCTHITRHAYLFIHLNSFDQCEALHSLHLTSTAHNTLYIYSTEPKGLNMISSKVASFFVFEWLS